MKLQTLEVRLKEEPKINDLVFRVRLSATACGRYYGSCRHEPRPSGGQSASRRACEIQFHSSRLQHPARIGERPAPEPIQFLSCLGLWRTISRTLRARRIPRADGLQRDWRPLIRYRMLVRTFVHVGYDPTPWL